MDLDRQKLEREIEETTRSLQRNIALLEEKTLKTVEGVTENVKNTAEKIRSGVQELSLTHQMEERPKAVIATAIGVGLVAGLRLFRRRGVMKMVAPSIGKTLVSAAVTQATQTFLPMALGFAAEWVADQVTKRRSPGRPRDFSKNGYSREDSLSGAPI